VKLNIDVSDAVNFSQELPLQVCFLIFVILLQYFELHREKRSNKTKKVDASFNQKFKFSDGFICSVWEPNLVLGVHGIDLDNISNNVEVVLCHKSVDDPGK